MLRQRADATLFVNLNVGVSLEIGCWNLEPLDSVFLPDRDELVPLFNMLLNDGLEDRHDFLSEFLPRSQVAQAGAFVGNFRKNVGLVGVSTAR